MTSYPPSRFGSVTVEGDHATIVFERRLPHSPEAVWQAITESEQLAKWYMTTGQIDGRAGGSIDYLSGPAQLHVTGRILSWEPPRLFEHEWNVDPMPGFPKGERSTVRWELSPEGQLTVLRLTHRNLTSQTASGFVSGVHAFLDRLEAQLDKIALPDWMERVVEVRSSYPSWKP